MNAIPLSAPDGTVYAYACGICRQVRTGLESLGLHTDKDVAEFAESFKEASEDCCKCSRCGVATNNPMSRTCDACKPIEDAENKAHREKFAAEDAVHEAAQAAALAKSKDSTSALALRDLMSDISEEYHCAGWLTGLERELWAMVQGGDRRFGLGEVDENTVKRLRDLHERSGGWWRYDDEHGEMFVTTEEWQSA
jgi:hypothetical protein